MTHLSVKWGMGDLSKWGRCFWKGGGGGSYTFTDYEKNKLMIVRKFSYLGDKRRPFVKNFNSKIKQMF